MSTNTSKRNARGLVLHMFCKIIPFLYAATLLAGDDAPGHRVLALDLDKAIGFALAKNFSIEVSRYEPKIAKEQERTAKGKFDPNFDISFRRGEATVRDQFRRDASGAGHHFSFDGITQSNTWSTGVSGVTVWGLGYDVGLSSRRQRGTFNRFDADYASEASFSVSQPLLRDAGTDAQLAGVRVARNNVVISEWGLKERVIAVITDVIDVYNELHFAHENLEVAKRTRGLAQQLLQDNIKRVEVGVMKALDVTTAQAEVAAREEAVITTLREVKDQENFLKQLITADLLPLLGTRVEIVPPKTPDFAASVIAGVREALELRPDYRQAKLDLENRHIAMAFEKNQTLPRLDLTGSLSLLGLDDDFGTSAQRTTRRDQSAWNAGATFSIPLGNQAARGRYNAAQLESAQALVRLQQLEQDIIVRVDNANGAVVTAKQRIEATRESHRLAKESLDAGEKRLVAGSGTVFEVLELQKKLAEAETAELRAKADYNKAVAQFQQQTGTTLRVRGVKVE